MEHFFRNLGLNDKEIAVFLKLLELGAQPVSVLAKHVGLPRSSTYSILEGLRKHKVIREFDRFGIKYVQALEPKELQQILERQDQSLQQQRVLLERITPQLEKIQSHLSITPKVNFYEGPEEVFLMYETVLKKPSFDAYFNAEIVEKHSPVYAFKIPETLKKEGKTARELVVANSTGKAYQEQYCSKKHQIRLLPKEFKIESDTIITKDALYLTAYGENEISGIEIFQESLTKTQKMLFENLWKQAE